MATQVLVLRGEHGDEYFNVPTMTALDDVALKILTERFNQGYWYDEDEDDYAAIKLCVENCRAQDAFFLLRARSEKGYEYEGISVETLQGNEKE